MVGFAGVELAGAKKGGRWREMCTGIVGRIGHGLMPAGEGEHYFFGEGRNGVG